MKIKMTIAGGYQRGELKSYIESRGTNTLDATREWIDQKFGTWIRMNLTDDFTITNVTKADFVIDFASDEAAVSFREQVGGKVVD